MGESDIKVLHQGVSELWDAVNELRQGDAKIMAKLASIESLLTERCASRAQTLLDVRADIKTLQDKYNLTDKLLLKNTLIVSAITALLSSVATALAAKILGKIMGM